MFIDGHGRKSLVRNTALSVTGSAGVALGTFAAGQYSRLTGLFSIISSGQFRYEMGADSSAFQVSSSFTVSSGGSGFDVLNLGSHLRLSFSQLASQTGATVLVLGEPTR
jgi:hypothetical protein